MVTGVMAVWAIILEALSPDHDLEEVTMLTSAPEAVRESVPAMLALSAAAIKAYPGPELCPRAAQGAVADLDPDLREQYTASHSYHKGCFKNGVILAAAFVHAVEKEVWSRALGTPATSLKPDTPQAVLRLLVLPDAQYLLLVGLLLVVVRLYKQHSGRYTAAFCQEAEAAAPAAEAAAAAAAGSSSSTSSSTASSSTKRGGGRQRRQQQPQQVRPWHEKLAGALGLSAEACDELMDFIGCDYVDDLDPGQAAAALTCCLAANMANVNQVGGK